MKSPTFRRASFSNKLKEIEVEYKSGKKIILHYGSLGIRQSIERVWIDKETHGKAVGIELSDKSVDFLPYDQPLAIAEEPEYILQNHMEKVIASIREKIAIKKISKKYLARQLGTSDNQIQRLLNPEILNENLGQLYKLASLLNLQVEVQIKKAA